MGAPHCSNLVEDFWKRCQRHIDLQNEQLVVVPSAFAPKCRGLKSSLVGCFGLATLPVKWSHSSLAKGEKNHRVFWIDVQTNDIPGKGLENHPTHEVVRNMSQRMARFASPASPKKIRRSTSPQWLPSCFSNAGRLEDPRFTMMNDVRQKPAILE